MKVFFYNLGYEDLSTLGLGYRQDPPEPVWMGGFVVAKSRNQARHLTTLRHDFDYTASIQLITVMDAPNDTKPGVIDTGWLVNEAEDRFDWRRVREVVHD